MNALMYVVCRVICVLVSILKFIISEWHKAEFIWASGYADALGSSRIPNLYMKVLIYTVCRVTCMLVSVLKFIISEWHKAEFICPLWLAHVQE